MSETELTSRQKSLAAWKREAERRRALRRKLDLTIEEIATRVGVSTPTVQRWERGARRPNKSFEKAWEAAIFKEAK